MTMGTEDGGQEYVQGQDPRGQPLVSADGIPVAIISVHLEKSEGLWLSGSLQQLWQRRVDRAPEYCRDILGDVPILVDVPAGLSRLTAEPPVWRLAVVLETGHPVGEFEHEASGGPSSPDGSHLVLVIFRETILDRPIPDVVAPVLARLNWRQNAENWRY